jgi:hypothetical protein
MAKTNANLIWKIADLLRGPYQPNQYGDVILPFTILRRLDCILEPTKRAAYSAWQRSTNGEIAALSAEQILTARLPGRVLRLGSVMWTAWYFAIYMALHPENAREKRVNQASWTAAMGAWYLQPPTRFTPFPMLVRAIAKRESRDVAANLRALATIRNTPEKLDKSYL